MLRVPRLARERGDVIPEKQAGHEALAIDLPGDDDSAGIHAYADEVPGGHLVALSRPRELADRLLAYRPRSEGEGKSTSSIGGVWP